MGPAWHARLPAIVLVLFLVPLLCAASAAAEKACMLTLGGSDATYDTRCSVGTVYDEYGFFDCQCVSEGTDQPVLPPATFAISSDQPGFSWWAVNVADGITAQYNITINGNGTVSDSAVGPSNVTGPFRALSRAPAPLSFSLSFASKSADEVGAVSAADKTGMTAGWLPCRSDKPVSVTVPGSPAAGGNSVTVAWSAPATLDSPLERLVYDVLLWNATKAAFVPVGQDLPGTNLSLHLTNVQRKCDGYKARVQTTGVRLDGTRGPSCPEPYTDADFFVRGPPARPGKPQVDYSTLTSTFLDVVWTMSPDDGGCSMSYTLSLMDGAANLTYAVLHGRTNASAILKPPVALRDKNTYQLVLEAHSLGGSTMTESFFSVPAEKKQKNTGAIVGSAIAACFVAGIVCVFVWRRRQLGDYQPLT